MIAPPYQPPVLRVRVAPPMLLVNDVRSPRAILDATLRDGFPCWEPLVAAWSERRPPAAESVVASLEVAVASPLVVAFSTRRSPGEAERVAITRLLAEGARAVVIIVREPELADDPASCHVDADGWEVALADGFDRVCVRQWIWSCQVPDAAWAASLVAASGQGSDGGVQASDGVTGSLWLAGAVFGGVRSRRFTER